jgi:pentatricopeptide repeat protein
MTRAGLTPELELYSAALRAAAAASDARSAEAIFSAMTAAGVKPDASAGGSLLAALRKGGASGRAAQLAERFRCSIFIVV